MAKMHDTVPPFSVGWVVFFQATDPATDPANEVGPGKLWVETDDDAAPTQVVGMHIWSVDDSTWLPFPIGSSSSGGDADTLDGLESTDFRLKGAPVSAKTANYTAVETDEVIFVDTTSGAVTIALPAAASVVGVHYFIMKTAGGNDVTINPDGSEEINDSSTLTLSNVNEGAWIVSNGTEWKVTARPGHSAPPTGAAGGVLDGTYPDPDFDASVVTPAALTILDDTTVANMRTTLGAASQTDLDAAETMLTDHETRIGDEEAATIDFEDRITDLEIGATPAVEAVSTTTYTYVLGDAGKYKRFTNAAGCAVTVPANASVAFAIGTELHGIGTQDQVEIIEDSGVTVNTAETLFTAKAFAGFTLKKVATNEWDLIGYLEPV